MAVNSKDIEALWKQYSEEGAKRGISVVQFFESNGVPYNSFEKWYKKKYSSNGIVDCVVSGSPDATIQVPGEEKDLEKLNGDLARLNHLMIIKLHPMDKSQLYEFKTYSNILIVKQKDMKSQLYPLLGRTDYLLTDFSSVCIDYDILKKPMGFTIPDFDSYSNSRGFVFNDVLSILPGPIITNYEELVQFIRALYYKPSTLEFNQFRDNKACERLVNFLKM